MSSIYITSDPYNSAALEVGIEMDMEVKSEPDSDNELCDSTESRTSSVEEVSMTRFLESQSDEEELEEEPLVEIDSITVPQELVEVELEPSLLLFVNRDPTHYTSNKTDQASVSVAEKNPDSTEQKTLREAAEKIISDRKSITKALRNIKRKHIVLKKDATELCLINTKYNVTESVNMESGDNDENNLDGLPSACDSSSEISDTVNNYPYPQSNRKSKTKHKKVKIKTNKQQNVERKNEPVKEEKEWNESVPRPLLKKLLKSAARKRKKRGKHVLDNKSDKKENTQSNSEEFMKENVLNNENNELQNSRNSKNPRKLKCGQRRIIKENKKLIQMVKPESFDCTVCGKKFREKSHLATHARAHIDVRNYKCNECGHLFKTKTNLFFHMKTHEESPFICEKCNKTFPERKMLMRHIRVVHSGEGNYNCDQCGRSFKSAQNLDLHYTLHTGNKPFTCNVCRKSFVYKSTYTAHMRAHDADDSFSCDLCPMDVLNRGELRRRCNHFSEARPWLCTVCGKGYPLKGTLKNHMKTHEPEKPFKCNDCGKAFMKKQSYECHMKIHTGENPQYMCDQCSQSYFNVFALKRHYMKHTSERKFVCDICNKAFWMKDALKVHKRSHASVKMFHCTQCSKAFAHKHTLVAHLRTHSSEQPFSCTLCPKTFIHKYNLDRHERQHSVPPIPPLQPSLPIPPTLIMMAPPKHFDLPTLHVL